MEISYSEWQESRLPGLMRSLELLGSDDPELDVENDSSYFEALGTVLEELDEAGVEYNSDTAPAALLEAQYRVLNNLGHNAGERSRAHALALLCGELQVARKTAAVRSPMETDGAASEDARLAYGLSRTCAALRVPGTNATDKLAVATLLRSLATRARTARSSCDTGAPLLDSADVNATQRAQLEEAAASLASEYAQRREQIAARLHSTASAFSSGPRAGLAVDARAVAAVNTVMAQVPPPPRFGLAHATAARNWLAAPRAVSSTASAGGAIGDAVKRTLMGEVPDRGGRIGAAAARANDRPVFDKTAKSRKGRKSGKTQRNQH